MFVWCMYVCVKRRSCCCCIVLYLLCIIVLLLNCMHGVYTVDVGLSYLAATFGVNCLVLCIRLDRRPVPRGPSVTK